MTRALLEQALEALETCRTIQHGGFILGDEQLFSEVAVNAAAKDIRAHLAQPQGAPATLNDAMHESLTITKAYENGWQAAKATCPAWHGAPTEPGLWAVSSNKYSGVVHVVDPAAYDQGNHRWYGPIPEDKP
jgi:hypothetical protein